MEDVELIKMVLDRNPDLNKVFENGESTLVLNICEQILSIDKEDYLSNILDYGSKFNSRDIIMFSSFEIIYDLIEQLLFTSHPYTYLEIGKLILKTQSDGAYIKYGENHSKLANEMKLVSIKLGSNSQVELTSFGKLIATRKIENVDYILNLFLLSNPLIQTLIYQINNNNKIRYKDYVSNLARSTQIRRRPNIKLIVSKLTDYFGIENVDVIDWRV